MTDGPDGYLFIDEEAITPPTWDELDATPNDALRELMGELEDLSEQHKENADDWHHGFGCGVGRVINELEELIDDE